MATSQIISISTPAQSPEEGIPEYATRHTHDDKWHPATSPACAGLDYLESVSIPAARIMGKSLENPFNRESSYGHLSQSNLKDLSCVTLEDLQATRRNFQALDQRIVKARLENVQHQEEFDMLQNCQARERTVMEVSLRMAELELAFPEDIRKRLYIYTSLSVYALAIDTLKDLSEISGEREQAEAMDECLECLSLLSSTDPLESAAPQEQESVRESGPSIQSKSDAVNEESEIIAECRKMLAKAEECLALAKECEERIASKKGPETVLAATASQDAGSEDSLLPRSDVNSILLDFESPDPKWAKPFLQAINDADDYVCPDGEPLKMIANNISKILYKDRQTWDRLMHVVDGDRIHIPGAETVIGHMVAHGMIAGIMFASTWGIGTVEASTA